MPAMPKSPMDKMVAATIISINVKPFLLNLNIPRSRYRDLLWYADIRLSQCKLCIRRRHGSHGVKGQRRAPRSRDTGISLGKIHRFNFRPVAGIVLIDVVLTGRPVEAQPMARVLTDR